MLLSHFADYPRACVWAHRDMAPRMVSVPSDKRGSFAFVKKIKNEWYLCSIELVQKDTEAQCEIATFFRTTDTYLRNFELLWEWKGGNLHRSAFDSGSPRPSSTPQ